MKTKETFKVKNLISGAEYTYLSNTAETALIDCVIHVQGKVSNLINTDLRNKIKNEIEIIISKKENTIHYLHEETNLIITVYQLNNKTMKTKIENFLLGLNTEIDVLNLIDIDNIDYSDAFNSIYEMIDDNRGFSVDIIYYSSAIDYLSKNDPSLRESLELSFELGFSLNAINSELLASLLASQKAREEFYELEDEINDFFLELEEEEEEEN